MNSLLQQHRTMSQDAVSRGAAVLESGNGAEAATAHFQRLLLEAVANGSASGHSDIESLLCCTLIRHQVLPHSTRIIFIVSFLLPPIGFQHRCTLLAERL